MVAKLTRENFALAAGMALAVIITAAALIAMSATAQPASATVGQAAPAFSEPTASGDTVSLSDFEGQTVVLEWTNHLCPFVQKHYNPEHANMQRLQNEAAIDEIVWISVISSAPGKQGHVDAEEALRIVADNAARPSHVILDADGSMGRAYGAKTTPHMFVIRGDGTLAYDGAIDSEPSARVADIPKATNYLRMAMASVAAGEPADPATTKPYGCSVKY